MYVDCSKILIKNKKMTANHHSIIQPSHLENIVVGKTKTSLTKIIYIFGDIILDPCELNFGEICPNGTSERRVTVTNKSRIKVVIKIEVHMYTKMREFFFNLSTILYRLTMTTFSFHLHRKDVPLQFY